MPKRLPSWGVSDAFWAFVEPHIPKRERDKGKAYKRKAGGGRKPLAARKAFAGIVYVLRTGVPWKSLPKAEFGAGSSVHKYFQEWEEAGVFLALWKAGLAEYDEMEGIKWEWQSIDGAHLKAPMGKDEIGPNPTDRGKKRVKAKPFGRRAWRPFVYRRMRRQPA